MKAAWSQKEHVTRWSIWSATGHHLGKEPIANGRKKGNRGFLQRALASNILFLQSKWWETIPKRYRCGCKFSGRCVLEWTWSSRKYEKDNRQWQIEKQIAQWFYTVGVCWNDWTQSSRGQKQKWINRSIIRLRDRMTLFVWSGIYICRIFGRIKLSAAYTTGKECAIFYLGKAHISMRSIVERSGIPELSDRFFQLTLEDRSPRGDRWYLYCEQGHRGACP